MNRQEVNGGGTRGHKPGLEQAAAPGSRKTALTLELGGDRLDLKTNCDINSFLLLVAG